MKKIKILLIAHLILIGYIGAFSVDTVSAGPNDKVNAVKEKVQTAVKQKKENKETLTTKETPSNNQEIAPQSPEVKNTEIKGATPVESGSEDDIFSENNSGNTDDISENIDIDSPISAEEKEKVKKDINAYIIESYKAQGTKIIKDLDVKLQKSIPNPSERRDAYQKILDSLEQRKKRLDKMKATETKKMILREFLNHMITMVDKKIKELEK